MHDAVRGAPPIKDGPWNNERLLRGKNAPVIDRLCSPDNISVQGSSSPSWAEGRAAEILIISGQSSGATIKRQHTLPLPLHLPYAMLLPIYIRRPLENHSYILEGLQAFLLINTERIYIYISHKSSEEIQTFRWSLYLPLRHLNYIYRERLYVYLWKMSKYSRCISTMFHLPQTSTSINFIKASVVGKPCRSSVRPLEIIKIMDIYYFYLFFYLNNPAQSST